MFKIYNMSADIPEFEEVHLQNILHEQSDRSISQIVSTLKDLPKEIQDTVLDFDAAHIEQQAEAINAMLAAGLDVQSTLRSLSIEKKLNNEKFHTSADTRFIDPTIHKVMDGHDVEMFVEVPLDGVSRAQSQFFQELMFQADSQSNINVIGLDTDKTPRENEGSQIGIQELLHLLQENPDHPAFIMGNDIKKQLAKAMSHRYAYTYMRGIVREPPTHENEGVLTLMDGSEVEMCNIKICNIVGADTSVLLDRAPDEIYRGRRVRVFDPHATVWREGEVALAAGPRGLVEVRCDEQIHENMHFLDGHGLTVPKNSSDLDLRDPRTCAPKEHILEKYPNIRTDRCIHFRDENGLHYAIIRGINSKNKQYEAFGNAGEYFTFPFDKNVLFIQEIPASSTSVKKGNKVISQSLDGEKRVYEIYGFDPEYGAIITHIVSLRPSGMPICNTFHVDDPTIEIVENNTEGLFERFPTLKDYVEFSEQYQLQFADEDGTVRVGRIHNMASLPAYIEVLIPKKKSDIEEDGDVYHRFNVPPERIIDAFSTKESFPEEENIRATP